jgi:DNA replication protein DnaC
MELRWQETDTEKEMVKKLAMALDMQAKKRGKKQFIYTDENKKAIREVFRYLHKAYFSEANLTQGILLVGYYGSGKTTLLNALKECLHGSKLDFNFVNAPKLVDEYERGSDEWQRLKDSFKTIYVAKRVECVLADGTPTSRIDNEKVQVPNNIALDELGAEPIGRKAFQGQKDIVSEILYQRAEKQKAMTIGSTNLGLKALHEFYGPRLASRFKELWVEVDFGADPDTATDFRDIKK